MHAPQANTPNLLHPSLLPKVRQLTAWGLIIICLLDGWPASGSAFRVDVGGGKFIGGRRELTGEEQKPDLDKATTLDLSIYNSCIPN